MPANLQNIERMKNYIAVNQFLIVKYITSVMLLLQIVLISLITSITVFPSTI